MSFSVIRLFFAIVAGVTALLLAELYFLDPFHKLIAIFLAILLFSLSVSITRYGVDVLLKMFFFVIPLVTVPYFLESDLRIKLALVFLGLALLAITLQFLRNPKRIISNDVEAIVSVADGRVISVSELKDEVNPIGEPAMVIAIFMSPFDAHVNRVPIEGQVIHVEHKAGTYLKAFKLEAGTLNEQTKIVIEKSGYKVAFKQISGFVARRIVCNLKIGEKVKKGQKFGMIKFGSRSDVFLPKRATILVKQDDIVKAGSTILAKL